MQRQAKFSSWLEKMGAEILPPTNEWEVLRFRTPNGTSIIYRKASGILTYTGESDKAYIAFRANQPWKPVDRKRAVLRRRKQQLAQRDGMGCFYCSYTPENGLDELTVEHLLSIRHGGPDNVNNLCLACEACNRAVGIMSVTKKIKYREEARYADVH